MGFTQKVEMHRVAPHLLTKLHYDEGSSPSSAAMAEWRNGKRDVLGKHLIISIHLSESVRHTTSENALVPLKYKDVMRVKPSKVSDLRFPQGKSQKSTSKYQPRRVQSSNPQVGGKERKFTMVSSKCLLVFTKLKCMSPTDLVIGCVNS